MRFPEQYLFSSGGVLTFPVWKGCIIFEIIMLIFNIYVLTLIPKYLFWATVGDKTMTRSDFGLTQHSQSEVVCNVWLQGAFDTVKAALWILSFLAWWGGFLGVVCFFSAEEINIEILYNWQNNVLSYSPCQKHQGEICFFLLSRMIFIQFLSFKCSLL